MPVPTLPLTIRITVATMIGSTTREIRKLRVALLSRPRARAAMTPQNPAKSRQSRYWPTEKLPVRIELKIDDMSFSSFYHGNRAVFFFQRPQIGGSVFGEAARQDPLRVQRVRQP